MTRAALYRAATKAIDDPALSSQGGKLFADLPAQAQDAMLWISKAGKIDLGASDATTFSKNALAEAPRRGCFRIYGGNKDMAG